MVQLTISPIEVKDGAINVETWLNDIATKYHIDASHLLRQAVVLAQTAGIDHAAPNGESCLHQGLTMAEILAELNLDNETLAAAVIYSSVRYAGLNLEDVTEHLGHNISKLIKGTMQMEAIHILHSEKYHIHQSTNIDNIRKMLLAMVDDVRVVLMKLAERLCILRNVIIFNDNKKKQTAKETLDIYAPLANRLGIGQLKWQLEDLSFRYLEPDKYKNISESLNEKRVNREKFVREFIKELQNLLATADIQDNKINGRAKHIYSIYKKMQKKRVDISEIYDINAVRILVPTIDDCYTVLSNIHAKWKHVLKEFDNYITNPKPNGYRSIHTVIMDPKNKHVEIQIRTYQMHQEAELGVAAHWMYKEGKRTLTPYEEKIAWLRQVMDWQKEITQTEEAKEEIQQQVFDDHVYVFTPQGQILDLPKGATPLDFAYHVHSDLGHRCRGAKINGHIVPLSYSLNTGEQVEILTIKQGQPSRDWLNSNLGYLKTSRAKAKVLQWFRKQDYENNIIDGRDQLEKEFKRLNIKNIDLSKLANKLNYKNTDDFLAALGRGDLRMSTITQATQPSVEKEIEEFKPELPKLKPSETITDIDIHGIDNLLTHIALCCKPIPGDLIVGYVTQGKGISIHRNDCTNILRHEKIHDERLIEVSWGKKTLKNYPVDLSVNAYNRQDLIRDITNILVQENIPLLNINCVIDKNENKAHMALTIEITSLAPLSKVLARINQLSDVYEVKRLG